MAKVTEIRVDFSRTFVPPGGDRYQPMKISAGLTIAVEEGDDLPKVKAELQPELRQLLEDTYRAQHKPKQERPAQQPLPDQSQPPPTQPAFKPAQPSEPDPTEY